MSFRILYYCMKILKIVRVLRILNKGTGMARPVNVMYVTMDDKIYCYKLRRQDTVLVN